MDDEVAVKKEDVLPYVERALAKFPNIRVVDVVENTIPVEGFPRVTVVYIGGCDWDSWRAFVREVKSEMPAWMGRNVLIVCIEKE